MGDSLQSVFQETGCFSAHIIGLIHTGEQVGRAEEAFLSISTYYARRARRKQHLQASLRYPTTLFILTMVVVVVLLTQVLPIFNDVYGSLGGQLSGAARLLLVLGNHLHAALPYLGIVAALILVAVALISLIPALQNAAWRAFYLTFGDRGAYRLMNNASFAQSLSVAVSCGIPYEEAVAIAARMLSDIPSAEARCRKCAQMIEEGMALDVALEKSKLFSRSACYLLKLAIRAGKGDETLQDISERMSQDAEDAMNATLAKIEPALVIITSLITGAILLSVMLPLVDIMNAIG
jgi:type IV pilus assembly protein PilC